MIDLSIVTGTYNRLPHLQKFVDSVRASILPCLSYEIVLVDGGSKDGTIAWCKQQRDIVLIEQGELLGAVKAFNAGFAAAKGKYCVAANDDITFEKWSLSRAYTWMESHPYTGQGCFYQKRGRLQHWHVEHMMASQNGRKVSVPYGQIAIVPRWLGDKVGWWGNVTRTYGGDNELSANIWEAGYKVEPIPGTRIVDQMVKDNLRQINQGDPKEWARRGEQHPDTAAWYREWPNGPTIPAMQNSRELGEVRILYVPLIDYEYPIVMAQKYGLRQALKHLGRVVEYNYRLRAAQLSKSNMRRELAEIAEAWQPQIVLTQVHSTELLDCGIIDRIRELVPNTQIINWNGDYRSHHFESEGGWKFAQCVDVQCLACAEDLLQYQEAGISVAYWQIGYEPAGIGFEPNGNTPHHDVLFLGNCYTEGRRQLEQALLSTRYDVGLYGWGWSKSNGKNLYDFQEGCRLYRAAKIAVGDQQWSGAEGYVSNRLFQAMAAGGALFLQQRFAGMEKWLGLQDRVHLLCWSNLDHLCKLIKWALNPTNASVVKQIAQTGHEYVLQHHSFDNRVQELESVILQRRQL